MCNDGFARGGNLQAAVNVPHPMHDCPGRQVLAQLVHGFHPAHARVKIPAKEFDVFVIGGQVLNYQFVHEENDTARWVGFVRILILSKSG